MILPRIVIKKKKGLVNKIILLLKNTRDEIIFTQDRKEDIRTMVFLIYYNSVFAVCKHFIGMSSCF